MFKKTYKKALRAEIIARIDFDGYFEADAMPTTGDEKIIMLVETAKTEASHEFSRNGDMGGLQYWLSGLPSVIDLPVYNGEVIEFAEKIGSVENPTEKECEKITENFYRFMAVNILQMYVAAIRRIEKSEA